MSDPKPACDLVMKGGITSGVIYPKLIARLAERWRFKSVGGTSAGAIAAAGCAAAELGRVSGRHPEAFARLAELPETLSRPALAGGRDSKLLTLFQPAPWLADHFHVLLGALNRKNKLGLVAGALAAMLRKFWFTTLVALALMGLLGTAAVVTLAWRNSHDAVRLLVSCGVGSVLIWLVAAWLPGRASWRVAGAALASAAGCAGLLYWTSQLTGGRLLLATGVVVLWLAVTAAVTIAAVGTRFVLSLLGGLRRNHWGMCAGHSADETRQPQALTDWLVDYFDGLAGRDGKSRPLTFGDLWGEPEGPPRADAVEDRPVAEREVDLQVMTTAVSQQMCYALPWREGTGAFYYDPTEWNQLFPKRVMAWLDEVANVLEAGRPAVTGPAGRPLRRLPPNRHLPVVVAVRMSLSFPVLLSAVPLYAVDRSLQRPGEGEPVPTKVWFSDGGIASNMPLHFFDAALPRRPTFAVNLKKEHPCYPIDPAKKAAEQKGRVYLAANEGGRSQYWPAPNDDSPAGLFDFLGNIVDTMQNWRDQILFPYPGYRDRIVQISQRDDEGGLNLNMPAENIARLADAGEFAADTLDARFNPANGSGWTEHREVRLRAFLALAEELLRSRGLQDAAWDEVVQLVDARDLDAEERKLALEVLDTLRRLGAQFESLDISLARRAPRPRAQMRISPRI